MTLADDSGLEVDYLNGAPGIYSARFFGAGATDEANNRKLLSLLEGIPEEKRTARFVCQMVLYLPEGTWIETEGFCPGIIARAPRGEHGFGYDPVFYLPEFNKTMAELPLEEKNRISHRTQALREIRSHLEAILKT
jgi:XTP/dITP diphosphohydrolase